MRNNIVKNMVLSGLFLAIAMVLPLLTGQIPQIGSTLAPMHIPVLLCGFICGWPYGLVVGFVSPLLRFALFGMPPIFPTGVAMAFELAAYGFLTGLLYNLLPKKNLFIYVALIVAMFAGRLVWGAARVIIAGLGESGFTWAMFIAGGFVNAIPGIILHIVLIPPIIIALKKANLIKDNDRSAKIAA
jgi:riboflavin transporter FmnP